MASTLTPSNNRLRMTPSNSPFFARPSRSPLRARFTYDSNLSLKRVIGTTCGSPTGFDTVESSFAYIAGGAVVVADVDGEHYTQRFYRARPTAVPVYSVASFQHAPSPPQPNTTPKANDSRGRVALGLRDSPGGTSDWADSPSSRTWTSRERIKAATCLSLSPNGRHLAVGETGYAPRVLIFSLQDTSSDVPLVAIREHTFGVQAVAWSADSKYLASLGTANDGFLYVWKIDTRTGAARLFQQNRCTSYVRHMLWSGNNLITLGIRHVKMWKIEDGQSVSPTRQKFSGDLAPSTPTKQRTLPGRNVVLGSLLDATFTCAGVDGARFLVGTEAGDICTLDDDDKQMRLVKVLNVGFSISTMTIRGNTAYVGGKDGGFATLNVDSAVDGCTSSIVATGSASSGFAALGLLADKMVTIDATRSIDIWNSDYVPGQQDGQAVAHVPISGHGEAMVGLQALHRPNEMDAAFVTWSASGKVIFWDLQGCVKKTHQSGLEAPDYASDLEPANQLTAVRASSTGRVLATADRFGVLKLVDLATDQCILDTKAHASECVYISLYESDSKFLMACCGRDRTAQLFQKTSDGTMVHFQTLELTSRVLEVIINEDRVITCSMDRTIQVHDLVSRDDEPDVLAAIPYRVISLKHAPTSMTTNADKRTILAALSDGSVHHYDISTGREISYFKCLDETGAESAVLRSLHVGVWNPRDMDFLLASSNTDKSIRLYDASSGQFLDREWGHTEAINGVALLEDDDDGRKVVSVGSDATIMIWTLDLSEPSPRSMSRDPSPAKESVAGRPTLRRVLSRAELAEFQRPQQGSASGRRSPPRTLQRKSSRINLGASVSSTRTPTGVVQSSPSGGAIAEGTPSRRPCADGRQCSPPASPKARLSRRPSLPAMQVTARKKTSASNLRGLGTLNVSTEQTCRTLRAYRKKLTSAEPITTELLTELDRELRLTAEALGDRAIRSKAMNETVLSGLLDQYSERLVTLLDEKLRLSPKAKEEEASNQAAASPPSVDDDSGSSSP